MLALLEEKLQLAINILDGLSTEIDAEATEQPSLKTILSGKGEVRKLKYALYDKGRLDKIVKDLEEWHRRFDPSWYLLARAKEAPLEKPEVSSTEIAIVQNLRHAHQINAGLVESRESVFLPETYAIQSREQIPNTSAQIGNTGKQVVIIDPLEIGMNNEVQLATKDARSLARILTNVDPSIFSLLTCAGVIKVFDSSKQISGFEFIFTVPSTLHKPQSLRTFLLTENHNYPLDNRFQLAKLLGRSISFLHSSQIVHKNICPETVLMLVDVESGLDLPFLVGFEKFRRAEGRTYMQGDTFWERNLYRHPKRQGEYPEEEYKMQHDIYSLGVCLLEIGLGTSFVRFEEVSIWYVYTIV